MEEREYLLGISLINGLGPVKLKGLMDYFSEVASIWKAGRDDLIRATGSSHMADLIISQRDSNKLARMKEVLYQKEISYVTLVDANYPIKLKNIYNPPSVLFYKGILLSDFDGVAVVGSRKSTSYGSKIAENLAYDIAARDITIISGMARGIDTCAHLGALSSGGKTIAVLGTGVDVIYPAENRTLYYDIIANGAVVSEYPPGTEAKPGNFPGRNRIISGLSDGVIVVEAASKSGSLITADIALKQKRSLFAVPGNVGRIQSKGTNELIKKEARLITSADDIIKELYLYSNNKEKDKVIYPELSKGEEEILDYFKNEGELHINKIIELSGKSVAEINSILLKLELKGLISCEPGKKYLFLGLQNLLKPL